MTEDKTSDLCILTCHLCRSAQLLTSIVWHVYMHKLMCLTVRNTVPVHLEATVHSIRVGSLKIAPLLGVSAGTGVHPCRCLLAASCAMTSAV